MFIYESNRNSPDGGIYHQWNTDLSFYPHLHNSFELIYVYDGVFTVTVGEHTHSVNRGEAILIFPNQIHCAKPCISGEKPRTYLCIFQNDLVSEFYHHNNRKAPLSPVFSINDPLLIEKISAFNGSRYLLKAHLYELISSFDRQCTEYTVKQNRSGELIGKILLYISEHHNEKISMTDVARSVGYDYHYLSNLLQKNLGTTFRRLLNEYRISHAKHLLTTSGFSIANIFYECGYDSLCSFNRNFKALTGITPSEYRYTLSRKS